MNVLELMKMVRAQFLVGIIFPLVVGTLTAVSVSGSFHASGFILVLLIGLGLHLATDVYNDIYDTKQGADSKGNDRRSLYSGGSGILLEKPYLMSWLYRIARGGLLVSFLSMIGLLLVIDQSLWLYVVVIYGVSAFFSKYYTAGPLKFGYRGIGEFLIWLSFGPLAIMLACFSQNMMLQATLYSVMPATGLSTLTILWIGQLIDFPDDLSAGKRGLVIRLGTRRAMYGYVALQSLLILNVVLLVFFVFHPGWPLLLSLLPFLFLLPRIWSLLKKYHDSPVQLVPVAKLNTALYVLFSFFFILGIGLAFL